MSVLCLYKLHIAYRLLTRCLWFFKFQFQVCAARIGTIGYWLCYIICTVHTYIVQLHTLDISNMYVCMYSYIPVCVVLLEFIFRRRNISATNLILLLSLNPFTFFLCLSFLFSSQGCSPSTHSQFSTVISCCKPRQERPNCS